MDSRGKEVGEGSIWEKLVDWQLVWVITGIVTGYDPWNVGGRG